MTVALVGSLPGGFVGVAPAGMSLSALPYTGTDAAEFVEIGLLLLCAGALIVGAGSRIAPKPLTSAARR